MKFKNPNVKEVISGFFVIKKPIQWRSCDWNSYKNGDPYFLALPQVGVNLTVKKEKKTTEWNTNVLIHPNRMYVFRAEWPTSKSFILSHAWSKHHVHLYEIYMNGILSFFHRGPLLFLWPFLVFILNGALICIAVSIRS